MTEPVTSDVARVSDETLRGFVGYNIKRAFNVIQADLVKTLEPFGLRMVTYSALVLIVDNPGLRQSQLADALSIERPNMVLIIDELEARELIVREQSPTDRRAYALKVTLAGRRLCEKANEANLMHEKKILDAMGSVTVTRLVGMLNALEASGRETMK